MSDFDVVICGGGVGGLTLANVLGLQGRTVLVLDKQRGMRPVHKGEVFQPRSLEILKELGLLAPLEQRGALRMDRLSSCAADGAELMSLDYRSLPEPFNHSLVHYYKDIREVLAEGLPAGVEFRQGVTVEDLCEDSSGRVRGVRVNEGGRLTEIDAELVVACDGHTSKLRTIAGLDAPKLRYDHHLVSLDIARAPELRSDIITFLTGDGVRVLFQMPGGRARLYAQIPTGSFRGIGRAGLPEWTRWLVRSVPALEEVEKALGESVDDVQVMAAWRFNAPVWTRGGFVLLGDAAHCVHPMVGQGMNAAIADAWALGRQIAEAGRLTPRTVDAALTRYETERHPQMDYISRLSHNLAVLFTDTSNLSRFARPFMLRRNRDNRRLRHQLTYNVAGFGVRPFTAWDWICATGLVPDPRGRKVPAHRQ